MQRQFTADDEDTESFNRDTLAAQRLKSFLPEEEEPFEDEGEYEESHKARYIILALILVITGFASYALYKDKVAITPSNVQEIPLVKAENSPIKERPADPGGMVIPNMDKMIYQQLNGEEAQALPKVAHLLPPPEEPVERQDITPSSKPTEIVIENLPATKTTPAPVIKKEEPVKETRVAMEELPAAATEPQIKKQPVPTVKAITPQDIKRTAVPEKRAVPMAASKPTASAGASGYFIQLGAYRDEQEIQTNWARISKTFGTELNGITYNTERADLGDKGIFYRLQAGPLADKSEARALCQKLVDKKQGCFVVKR